MTFQKLHSSSRKVRTRITLHGPPLVLVLVMLWPCASLPAQEAEALPAYHPLTQVSGVIRIGGNHHQDVLLNYWEEGFRKFQPGVQFENGLKSTANAIPGLSFGLIDIGVMGRSILPIETLEFRREFKYPPTGVAVATGSYDVTLETAAFAIFVNKDNPLTQLTMKQLDAIFGHEHKRGAPQNIKTWGQLGLTEEWAARPINVYGYNIARFDRFFEEVVFAGSNKWNNDIHEYSDVYPPDGNPPPIKFAGQLMLEDLAKDPYGIAYCSIGDRNPLVKTIAIAEQDKGPFIPLTRETVANRSYPLTLAVYMYLNQAPQHALDPKVREFVTYILSREGQRDVSRQNVYFPLTTKLARKGLADIQK